MSYGHCRGCNKKILWGKDGMGRAVPLDVIPPVYRVTQTEDNNFLLALANQVFNTAEPTFFVSHFATCPKASEFSGSRRERTAGAGGPDVAEDQKRNAAGDTE